MTAAGVASVGGNLTCIIDDSPETITVGWQVLLNVPDGHLDHARLRHVHVDQLEPGAGLHSQSLRSLTGGVVASSKDNTSKTVKMSGHLMTNAGVTSSYENCPT